VREGKHYVQMNGREVFRFATRAMAQVTQEVVKAAQWTMDDVRLIIPHQANRRIIETALRSLDIPLERCMINVDRYGNTSTASIPIATCEAAQEGRLKAGDKIVFASFGAGLTWGGAAAIWSGPLPGVRRAPPAGYQLYARLRSFIKRLLRRIDAWLWARYYREL
jgi:3-oxoacyl-[acyl-carrier-protein] synthase III